ncbi:MAG: hypothetical protein RR420_01255 [Anaerovoracaceae bacterium]
MNEEKASEIIKKLYALQQMKPYMKNVDCEECGSDSGFEYDGRCKKCGAMNGKKVVEYTSERPVDDGFANTPMSSMDQSKYLHADIEGEAISLL